MEIKLLKSSIKSNLIPSFLIFTGEESYLCKQYITSISNTLNKHYKYYDNADEVLHETSTNLRDDFLYIILNDEKIFKNNKYVEMLQETGRNIILYFTDFDFKSTFYKENKDNVVNFKKLDKYTITAYLLNKLSINKIEVDQKKIELLVEYCDCSLSLCMQELDKIITLSQDKSNLLFDYMLNNGFSDYRKTNMYKFINKILYKDISLFDDKFKLNESIISLINVLYNQSKEKLQETNNHYYAELMKKCSTTDTGIKDGSMSDCYALEYLLLNVLAS